MNALPLSSVYAALLTLLFVALSVRVIGRRRGSGVALGSGGDAVLERRLRVHGNFAEYTPLGLLLLVLTEASGYDAALVHGLGLALLAGRAVHAFGVSRTPEDFRLRVAGMALTLGMLSVAAMLLLGAALR